MILPLWPIHQASGSNLWGNDMEPDMFKHQYICLRALKEKCIQNKLIDICFPSFFMDYCQPKKRKIFKYKFQERLSHNISKQHCTSKLYHYHQDSDIAHGLAFNINDTRVLVYSESDQNTV